ncbi:MAG: poly(R)-hydroxyalkanoic acid synthase subunit PhaE [Bacteroidota bacterium]
MAKQDTTNFVENMFNTQKQAVDSMAENTKKFTNGNNLLNETIEKGNDWYKNWLETQKNLFTKTADKAADATEKAKENTSKMNDFYENWFGTQMNWTKQMWEMNQDWAKNFATNGTATNSNPFTAWQNNAANGSNPFASWQNNMNNMNNWTSWMNNMQQGNNWMNQMQNMQNMNPFNADAFKKNTDNMTNMFNQYYSFLNNGFADFQKNFSSGTMQDAYKSMVNAGEGFTKFAEMWAPMFKSIQDNTFTMDTYKQWMNPELYKDFMDKYFSFMPEGNRQHMQQMTAMMNDGMKQMGQQAMNGFSQMRGMMDNNSFNPSQMFGGAQAAYTNWQNMMSEAAAPFSKMMTQNEHTKSMQEWGDIANRMMAYNVKNAELQYMIYNQGVKVMDKLAENTAQKMQDGTEVTSMIALYQEWLNISDKVYVSLFESTEYSELMSEVSSLQMRLRKDVELKMEKQFKDIPVATRSEMDEVYKTIYDLKKQVRQLEKMLDMETEETIETETEEPAAKKAATSNGRANTTAPTGKKK